MAMKVVSIKSEKVLDSNKDKMKVVNVETERVLETNPNIYLKRAEERLKNGQYEEALKEAEIAVTCSKNNHDKVLEQYNRIKDALNKKMYTITEEAVYQVSQDVLDEIRQGGSIVQEFKYRK